MAESTTGPKCWMHWALASWAQACLRQKCLMAAMADQLSPQTVLLNATKIAKSGKELLSTNIPAKELGRFADLALKTRGQKIRTVSVVPPANWVPIVADPPPGTP